MEGVPSVDEIQQKQAAAAAAEERRNMILDQILDGNAKQRLSRLALVKKEKARAVEDSLIRAATNGQLKEIVSYLWYSLSSLRCISSRLLLTQVTEEKLIAMLEQISCGGDDLGGAGGKKKSVVVQRRKYGFDEDDDDNDDDL